MISNICKIIMIYHVRRRDHVKKVILMLPWIGKVSIIGVACDPPN